MSIEIERGAPLIDGRYVAYVADDLLPAYVKPIVLMWHAGDWVYPMSDIRYRPEVFGWSGPLPVGKIAELFPVFDL